jgi:hypothetical protein
MKSASNTLSPVLVLAIAKAIVIAIVIAIARHPIDKVMEIKGFRWVAWQKIEG